MMTLAIILAILWFFGSFVFHVAGGIIHLLLILALVALIYDLVVGRRSVQ